MFHTLIPVNLLWPCPVFSVQQFDYDMGRCGLIFLGVLWIFLEWQVYVFLFLKIKFGGFSTMYFLEYFWSVFLMVSFLGMSIPGMLDDLILFHTFLRLCWIFFHLFPVCSPHIESLLVTSLQIHIVVFSVTSNLLWSPSSELFISVIIMFSSRISRWSFFLVSISLLRFSLLTH